jgi:hypothetical protein
LHPGCGKPWDPRVEDSDPVRSFRSRASECGSASSFEELRRVGANVAVAEDGVASDENFGARLYDVRNSLQVHATIYFNSKIQFAFGAHADEGSNFVQRIWNEFLTTEAGVDAHHQDVVDEVQDFREHLDGSRGIQNYAGLAAVRNDVVKGAIEVDAGFLMNRNPIGSGFGKLGNEKVRVFDHEVTIDRHLNDFTQPRDDRGTDGDVGNEVAVHNVDMEDCAATFDRKLRIAAELREVGRKDRGS